MMVMEKTKDIAVLMSMGTRKAQVRWMFIAQGVLIGVIGTAVGLVLGYAMAWAGAHSISSRSLPKFIQLTTCRSHPAPWTVFSGSTGGDRGFFIANHVSFLVRRPDTSRRGPTI